MGENNEKLKRRRSSRKMNVIDLTPVVLNTSVVDKENEVDKTKKIESKKTKDVIAETKENIMTEVKENAFAETKETANPKSRRSSRRLSLRKETKVNQDNEVAIEITENNEKLKRRRSSRLSCKIRE